MVVHPDGARSRRADHHRERNQCRRTVGSSSLTFTYDTVAPAVTAALVHDTGGTNNITSNDALTGTADANATVTLGEGSTVLGTTTANANGVWSFTPTGLSQGAQTITASETNAAGLTGSAALTFTYEPAGPTVTSVVATGSGITAGAGDVGAGDVVTLTVNLSQAVAVAGGTPTLTLNDGGTATYTGGSGTDALNFSYTVAAGQNTTALGVTAVNLNGATVTTTSPPR